MDLRNKTLVAQQGYYKYIKSVDTRYTVTFSTIVQNEACLRASKGGGWGRGVGGVRSIQMVDTTEYE